MSVHEMGEDEMSVVEMPVDKMTGSQHACRWNVYGLTAFRQNDSC